MNSFGGKQFGQPLASIEESRFELNVCERRGDNECDEKSGDGTDHQPNLPA
jgi:hypothetical protein